MASACSQRASGSLRARSIASSSFLAFFSPKTRGSESVPRLSAESLPSVELKDIQRLLDKTALHEFVRDDSAERFQFERAALREIFEAAGLLSGALRIFADPNGKLRISSSRDLRKPDNGRRYAPRNQTAWYREGASPERRLPPQE